MPLYLPLVGLSTLSRHTEFLASRVRRLSRPPKANPRRHSALLILVVGVAPLLLRRTAMFFEQHFGSPRCWYGSHPVREVPLLIPDLEDGIVDPPYPLGGQYRRGSVVSDEHFLGEATIE